MEQHMFVIRDSKSESYTNPTFSRTISEAERQFSLHVNEKHQNNLLNQFPEDFDLYKVGTYNPKTGIITELDTPQHIAKAVSLLKQSKS